MKHYVTLENCLGSKLKVKELFVYSIMKSSTDELNRTNITIDQISQWSNIPVKTIEKSILPELKKSGVFTLDSYWSNGKKRNSYAFPKPIENFRKIDEEFLSKNDLSPSQKGFMIALYMQAFNNSLLCGLSYNEIIKRLNLSNKTFYKYLNELVTLGYIIVINPQNPIFDDQLYFLDIIEYSYSKSSLFINFSGKNFF